MKKINNLEKNMKSNWWKILSFALIGIIAFCAVAVIFDFITFNVLPANLIGVLLGALISAIITQYLLSGQTSHEEVKECNVKVFKKRSKLFHKYIDYLWEILDKQGLDVEDYDILRKDFFVKLTLYLNQKNINLIADYLYKIGEFVNDKKNNYEYLKKNIFEIINILSNSINLGGKVNIEIDRNLEEPIYPKLFKQAILNEINNSISLSSMFIYLNKGKYIKEDELINDGKWGGEYICFDFRQFKGCKLLIGSFSKYCPYGSIWMMLYIEKNINSVDLFRYNNDDYRPSEFDKYVIGIWPVDKDNWVELTRDYNIEKYKQLGEFNPPPDNMWLFLDDTESLKLYRKNYRDVARIIGERASYWLENGLIINDKDKTDYTIIKFLEEFVGSKKEN